MMAENPKVVGALAHLWREESPNGFRSGVPKPLWNHGPFWRRLNDGWGKQNEPGERAVGL